MPSDPAGEGAPRRAVAAAVALMLGACACIAATSLMAKALGRGIGAGPEGAALPALQVAAGRFGFALLTLAPLVLWFRPSLKGAAWGVHVGRSLCGWAAVSTMFAAAAAMRLADATAISFLSPMIAMVLAIVILGERVGVWRWGAAGAALVGAVVLIRPGTEAFQPAALIALASALFMGMETVLIKKLTGSEPPLRILAINNTIGAAVAITVAAFVWVAPSPTQWAMLAAIGVVMLTAQSLFIQAMRRGDASFVVPFFYATLIFATLYDLAVFGEVPTAHGLAGAALIVGGAVVLAWREQRRR